MRIVRGSLLAVAGMTVALVTVSGAVLSKETDIILVERAATDTVIDVGEPGDTIGHMLAFGNDLYDAENTALVGRDQGQCFRSNPGMSWECVWTNILGKLHVRSRVEAALLVARGGLPPSSER